MSTYTFEFKPGQSVILTDTVILPAGDWVGASDVRDAAGNLVATWDVELIAPDISTDPWGLVMTFHPGDPVLLLLMLLNATGPMGTLRFDIKFMDHGGVDPFNTIYSETQYLVLVPAVTP